MTKNTLRDQKILILDFGSQYTQNIARQVRECHVYCEIHPYTMSVEKISQYKPKGIILSGGPASVLDEDAHICDPEIFKLKIPILGLCYGMQLITHLLGGVVDPSAKREYGKSELMMREFSRLFENVRNKSIVWMSHGDRISRIPAGFKSPAFTSNSPIASIENPIDKIYGLQFHPEVAHTVPGKAIFRNFLRHICECTPTWEIKSFAEFAIAKINKEVGQERVLCGMSGGVDSSVVAMLIHKAIGKRLMGVFIDNGLLRTGEKEKVIQVFRDNFHINLIVVDAADRFLKALEGVVDPEKKRKIIGNVFIQVFEEEAEKRGNFTFLAQGTLYPDVIESVSFKGPSAVIKTHHNVGGLPKKMKLKLIEPLRELFKDEVRALGYELGMSSEMIDRQPFPGPGLAVRILGNITADRVAILSASDKIILEEIKQAGLYNKIWQSFAVLLPFKTVGVMGDSRTYENVIAIRAVDSVDGMTADWVRLPYDLLGEMSNRIINEVRGVNRVVYDISSKPPSTIEWE